VTITDWASAPLDDLLAHVNVTLLSASIDSINVFLANNNVSIVKILEARVNGTTHTVEFLLSDDPAKSTADLTTAIKNGTFVNGGNWTVLLISLRHSFEEHLGRSGHPLR